MFLIIILGTMLFMWLALVFSYGVGAVHNGIYTLGITLLEAGQTSEQVGEILKKYTIKVRILHLIGLFVIAPVFLLKDYASFVLVYLFVWFFALMALYSRFLKKHALKLYELKKENGWLNLTRAQIEQGITDDEDIYWLTGKKDPNAKGILKERRVGFGLDVNTGRKDKIIIAVIGVFVLGIAGLLAKYDFATVTMERNNDHLTIKAADMRETISLTEIKDLVWMEDCPSMSKRHGYDGLKFNLGTFSVEGIGTCETYVYVRNQHAILVKTEKENIVFNLETDQKTREAYETLSMWIENKK